MIYYVHVKVYFCSPASKVRTILFQEASALMSCPKMRHYSRQLIQIDLWRKPKDYFSAWTNPHLKREFLKRVCVRLFKASDVWFLLSDFCYSKEVAVFYYSPHSQAPPLKGWPVSNLHINLILSRSPHFHFQRLAFAISQQPRKHFFHFSDWIIFFSSSKWRDLLSLFSCQWF